jgi:UDP-N-acetylglucosamine--N-acetylmuramyl-(pentapeptide) pyrophosphoryl-undecaprenol N-acetylglucosamine transferase
MKVLIAAGGTGGHLYPGIALAQEFKRQVKEVLILFVGTSRGLESKVLEREGFSLKTIRVEGLIGRGLVKILKALMLLPVSLLDACRVLWDFRPDLVIGIGGYASGPLVLLAGFFKNRRVILEPNAIPGWTNRILMKIGRVDLAVLAFEETRAFFPRKTNQIAVLGNPVRRNLMVQPVENIHSKNTLLVLGGSQGARSINLAMTEALGSFKRLKPDLLIIHQTGERDFEKVRQAYEESGVKARVEPFLFDMAQVYRDADLVLCRAGATTLAEITACGKPAILIPFPHATHGHQLRNAMALAEAGAAVMIEDSQLSAPVLVNQVLELIGNPERLRRMAQQSRTMGNPRATEEIVKRCVELASVQ